MQSAIALLIYIVDGLAPMPPNIDRIEFQAYVPDTLYRQADGHCSVPRCKNPTMGPYYQQSGAVNMGKACHIYSASENGPRGWGGQSREFISSERNGIWCCAYHSDLIDKSNGRDYPPEVLFAWKALAEARTLKRMNDSPSPLGWVDSIEISRAGWWTSPVRVTLSRFTLLSGDEDTGKTCLLEAAAALSHSIYAERFTGEVNEPAAQGAKRPAFEACVTYSTADVLDKSAKLKVEGLTISRHEGQIACLLPPGDLEVVFFSYTRPHVPVDEYEDDLTYFMRVLVLDKAAVLALAAVETTGIRPGTLRFQIRKADEDDQAVISHPKNSFGKPYMELLVRKSMAPADICFRTLSTSEQRRVILDFLINKAREVSKQRLTLLLIEDLITNFDRGNFSRLLQHLASQPFQILLSVPGVRQGDVIDESVPTPNLKDVDYLKPWRLVYLNAT